MKHSPKFGHSNESLPFRASFGTITSPSLTSHPGGCELLGRIRVLLRFFSLEPRKTTLLSFPIFHRHPRTIHLHTVCPVQLVQQAVWLLISAAAQLETRETLGYEFHRYRNYYIKVGIQCHHAREISISESGHRLVGLAGKESFNDTFSQYHRWWRSVLLTHISLPILVIYLWVLIAVVFHLIRHGSNKVIPVVTQKCPATTP